MARKRRRTKSRKSSKARRPRRRARRTVVAAAPRRRRRSRRRRSRAAKSHRGKRVRPVVIVSGGKFFRPRRSKYFRRPTRVNGRRRRRSMRRNPMVLTRSVLSMKNITHFLTIGAGMVAGNMVTSFLATGRLPFMTTSVYPAGLASAMQTARPALGLGNLLVGGFIAAKSRNPMVKDLALGIAAYGGFDLFQQILALVGVTQLSGHANNPYSMLGANFSDTSMPTVVGGVDVSDDGVTVLGEDYELADVV